MIKVNALLLIGVVTASMFTMALAEEDKSWSSYAAASKKRGEDDAALLAAECKAAGLKDPIRPEKAKEFGPPEEPAAAWWDSVEAKNFMATVLSFQTPSGGWAKGVNFQRPPRQTGEAYSPDDKKSRETSATIDNGSTTREIRFLAEAASHATRPDCQQAVEQGLEFLLTAQYPSGGWPQFYPLIGSYHDAVTFNDDAMAKVLFLLQEVESGRPPFAFLDAAMKVRAREAFQKGIACLLKAQVKQGGKLTGWCSQYEPLKLTPTKGRAFEPVALASAETSRLLQLLMSIEAPDADIITAVNAAGTWLQKVQLHGVAVEKRNDPKAAKGWDRFVVADPKAPPLWARFYELETMRPVFGSEEGTLHYAMDEIDYGRRVGYDWYDVRPTAVIEHQWPKWIADLATKGSVPTKP